MEACGPKADEPPARENVSLSEPVEETTSLLSGNHHEGLFIMTGPEVATDVTMSAQAANKQEVVTVVASSSARKATMPYKRSFKTQTAPSASSSHFFHSAQAMA